MQELVSSGRVLFGEDESKIVELKVYAHEFEDKLPSVIELDGRVGAYDIRDEFPEAPRAFTNPKPIRLLSQLFDFVLSGDCDLALDFFAGSGTTARAVAALNERDQGRRRFALVQLPEPLDPDAKDQRIAANFCDTLGKRRNIAELTKERLRRAAKKVKSENPLFSGDLGFRVFKLDSSNLRTWEPDRSDVQGSLEAHASPIKPGRSEQDLLYELLLKLGLELTVPIEAREIAGKRVHSVGAGTLMACLAEQIARDEIEPLAQGITAWHAALAPAGDTQLVFRDAAFEDDVAKTNLVAILVQAGFKEALIRSL